MCLHRLLKHAAAKDRGDRSDVRELGDWSRKGPLPDLPGRGDRRTSDRGYQSSRFGEEGGERRAPRDPESDGKIRDFGNWERKGPLSPLVQQERAPREGGRPRTNDGPRAEGFRDRRASPAAWGEGRSQAQGSGSQEGSRPPRREFQERPAVERAPTAADQDNQWRSKMRPDPPAAPVAKSPVPSREGSEIPASPALASASIGGRPRLNLAKRTVSEAPVDSSSSPAAGDAKASPFGAARPIDTAAKEKEIEEKRQQAIKEKKEADEKAKQEREAAKAKEAEENEKKATAAPLEGEERAKGGETIETENANGEIVDDKAVKPKEIVRDALPKPSDTGAWRRASNGPKPPRDDVPRGPRGRGDGHHVPRGPRHHDGGRNYRQNTNGGQNAAAPAQNPVATTETEVMEEDGWSTVSKPKKNNRGNAGQRAIAS